MSVRAVNEPNQTVVLEDAFRVRNVVLRLELHDGATWAANTDARLVNRLRMSLAAGASLRLLNVAVTAPTALLLYIERHATLDVSQDVPLTFHLVHTCVGSALVGTRLPPCHAAADDLAPINLARVDAASVLDASLLVLAGGAPPSRPGTPWMRHMHSYEQLQLIWTAPAAPGSSSVRAYTWVEYIAGRPVLTGDEIALESAGIALGGANGTLGTLRATRLSGFRRGYGILPGAIAALNAGGYSEFSGAWPSAVMGRPNMPRAPHLLHAAGELLLTWLPPDWNGGYPLDHYAISLQRVSASSTSYEPVALPGSSAVSSADHVPVSTSDALVNPDTLPARSFSVHGVASGEYRIGIIAVNSMGDYSAVSWTAHVTVDRRGWCGLDTAGGWTCSGIIGLIGGFGGALLVCACCCYRRALRRGVLFSDPHGGKGRGGCYEMGITSSTSVVDDEEYSSHPRRKLTGSGRREVSAGLDVFSPPRDLLGTAAARLGLGGLVGGGGARLEMGKLYAQLSELKEALEHERSLRAAAEHEKEAYRIELETVASELGTTPVGTLRSPGSKRAEAAEAGFSRSSSSHGSQAGRSGLGGLGGTLGTLGSGRGSRVRTTGAAFGVGIGDRPASPTSSLGSSAAARLQAIADRGRSRLDSPGASSIAGSTTTLSDIELSMQLNMPGGRPRVTPPQLQPPPSSGNVGGVRAKIMPIGAPPVGAPISPPSCTGAGTAGGGTGTAGGAATVWRAAYGTQFDGDTPRPSPDERTAAAPSTDRWAGSHAGSSTPPSTALSHPSHASPKEDPKEEVKRRVADLIAQRAAERTAAQRPEAEARGYGTPFSPPGSAPRAGGSGGVRGSRAGALSASPSGIELVADFSRSGGGGAPGGQDVDSNSSAASSCRSAFSDTLASDCSVESTRSDTSVDGSDSMSLLRRPLHGAQHGAQHGGTRRPATPPRPVVARASSAGRSRALFEQDRDERARDAALEATRRPELRTDADRERELSELARDKSDLRRRMQRWETSFEATHRRPPTDEDRGRSQEFGEMQAALRRRSQQLLMLSMSCGEHESGVKSSPGRELHRSASVEPHGHRRSHKQEPPSNGEPASPQRQQHDHQRHQHERHPPSAAGSCCSHGSHGSRGSRGSHARDRDRDRDRDRGQGSSEDRSRRHHEHR
jgi:hypothetical protein